MGIIPGLKRDTRFILACSRKQWAAFSRIGCETSVTAYSHDGEIDIVLNRGDAETVGVQVKRRRRSIGVERIREFRGRWSLMAAPVASTFPQADIGEARQLLAARCSARRVPVELVAADDF